MVLLLALSGPPAAAQVFLGAEVGPDAFLKNDEVRLDTFSDEAFAWALSAQISSSTLYSVFDSTEGEKEIFKYLRSGIYRQELITLILISEKTAVPFSKLVPELAKEGSLRSVAKKYGGDLPMLFSEAGEIKAVADSEMRLFMDNLSVDNSAVAMQELAAISESSGVFTAEISTSIGKKP